MSWKSLVSAGLLCVLGSPVLAAPTLTVSKGGTVANGHLDANGDWVWLVQIAPSNPIDDPAGTPMAVEIGFRETSASELMSAAIANTAVWDTANPGGSDAMQQRIFGWEALTDVDPGAAVNERPVGLQTNLARDEVSSYFGASLVTTTAPTQYLTIITDGPKMTSLTTSVQWLGPYNGFARIAELDVPGAGGDCPQNACNFDQYAGTASRTAKVGDANLDGVIDGGDYDTLLINWQQSGRRWYEGDFDGNGFVDSVDYDILLDGTFGDFNFDGSVDAVDYVVWRKNPTIFDLTQRGYSVWRANFGRTIGTGSSSLAAVPEPVTVAMFLIGVLVAIGRNRRAR